MKNKHANEVGVTEHDDNYVGVDPIYQNSAYEVTAPVTAEVDPDEAGDEDERKRVESEAEVERRVREHEANAPQVPAGEKTFTDWVADRKVERSGQVDEPVAEPEDADSAPGDGSASDAATGGGDQGNPPA